MSRSPQVLPGHGLGLTSRAVLRRLPGPVRLIMLLLPVLLLLAGPNQARGHNLGQSYTYLKIYDDRITGRFEIILDDLNDALAAAGPVEPITLETLNSRIEEVHGYIADHLSFRIDDKPLNFRFTGVDTLQAKKKHFILVDFTLTEDLPTPDAIEVDYAVMFDVDPEHTGMVLIEQFWRGNIFNNESRPALVFSATNRQQRLDLTDSSLFAGFTGVLKMGIAHILLGLDHVLFLVALILPAAMLRKERRWEPVERFRSALFYVIKIVTLFTVAHTLTLSLSALNVFTLTPEMVEPVIAISITIAAVNILYPVFRKKIAWVVFIFGLFHGFGFASVLVHLGVLGEHMALSLFAFNLGVEIGQVMVILIIFPVLYMIRSYAFFPRIVMPCGAAVLIVVSLAWFVDRTMPNSPVGRFVEISLNQLLG